MIYHSKALTKQDCSRVDEVVHPWNPPVSSVPWRLENPPAIAAIVRGYGGPRPLFVGSWSWSPSEVMLIIPGCTIQLLSYIYIIYYIYVHVFVGTGTQYKCVRIYIYMYMYHYVSTYVLYVNWQYIYTYIHVYTWDETWRNIINFIFDG